MPMNFYDPRSNDNSDKRQPSEAEPSSRESWQILLGQLGKESITRTQLHLRFRATMSEDEEVSPTRENDSALAKEIVASHRAAYGLNTLAGEATDFITKSFNDLRRFVYVKSGSTIKHPVRIDVIDRPEEILSEARKLIAIKVEE